MSSIRQLSGTLVGYQPEYQDSETGKWKPIKVGQLHLTRGSIVEGVPYPSIYGGILQEAFLCGRAQAHALAWDFAANWEVVHFHEVEVRITPFDIKYSVEVLEKEQPDAVRLP